MMPGAWLRNKFLRFITDAGRRGNAVALYCGAEASPGENPALEELFRAFAATAALLAAHLAFIAAANCARRSGVRLSFLFFCLARRRSLAAVACFTSPAERDFFWVGAEAFEALRAFSADTAVAALVLAAVAVAAVSSFRFSLASFFAPFCKRASRRRILFLRFLTLAIWDEESVNQLPIDMGGLRLRGNHETSPLSRHFSALFERLRHL